MRITILTDRYEDGTHDPVVDQVAEALRGRPWIHSRMDGPGGIGPIEHWLSADRQRAGERAGPSTSFLDDQRKVYTKYVPAEGVIYRLPGPPMGAADGPVKAAAGGKVELTVTVERKAGFKDVVSIYSGTPGVGPRQQGNNPLPPLATIAADKTEAKVSLDLPPTLPGGPHALVVRGQAGAAQPKGGNNTRAPATYPAAPVAVEVEGKGGVPKKW